MTPRSRTSIAKELRWQAAGIVRMVGIAGSVVQIVAAGEDVPVAVGVVVVDAADAEAEAVAGVTAVDMVGTVVTAAEDTNRGSLRSTKIKIPTLSPKAREGWGTQKTSSCDFGRGSFLSVAILSFLGRFCLSEQEMLSAFSQLTRSDFFLLRHSL